jgi:lipopolysaccharide transport system permease protein
MGLGASSFIKRTFVFIHLGDWQMESLRKIEVITPKRGVFDVRLHELWGYRDLILLFVRRDFVAQYKQTILGPLWFIIQPMLTALMFYVVFGMIASIPTLGVHQFLFYFTGLTVWGYFSECFTKTSGTFTANANLFGKVYFPRLTVPISIVISGLFKLLIQLIILIVLISLFSLSGLQQISMDWTIVLFPFYVILMAFLGLGLGILFSALTTKYRDLSFLLTFGVQLLMYATPIIYPLSFTNGKIHDALAYNPLTSIFENVRYSIYGIGQFDAFGLLYTAGFTLVVLVLGILVFNRIEQSFMDTV